MKKPLFELLVVCSTTHKPISIITLLPVDFGDIIPLYWDDFQNKIAYDKLLKLYPKLKGKVYIKSIPNTAGALYGT